MDPGDLIKSSEKLLAELFPTKLEQQVEEADLAPEPPTQDKLDSKAILTYLDLYYHDNEGKYPTIKQVAYMTQLPEDRVKEVLDNRANALLAARGLPEFETGTTLDPDFVTLVNMMADPTDQRSQQAKLKMLGKSPTWWRNMLRRPECRKLWNERVDSIFNEDSLQESKASLSRLIARDDLAAIKYTHELTGTFNPAQNQVLVLSTIIQALMQILAQHVTPTVLATIADELETSGILPQLGATA